MASPVLPGMVPLAAAKRHVPLAVCCLALAAAVGAVFARDLVARRMAASLLSQAGLDSGPGLAESLAICEAGDDAAAFATEAVMAALAPGVATGRYEPRGRDLLAGARNLAAVAVAERPGWAPHRLLLARAGYAIWDLEVHPRDAETRAWLETFRAAGAGAPGLDLTWSAAADACLSGWPRLSAPEREEAVEVLRRALLSSGYVRQAFPAAWRTLGARASALLPDNPDCLREAAAVLKAMGQPAEAQALEARRTRAGAARAE